MRIQSQAMLRLISNTRKINSSLPGQNGRHFADDIFRYIFVSEIILILIQISLKFVPKDPTDNILALVQIMAWLRSGHG